MTEERRRWIASNAYGWAFGIIIAIGIMNVGAFMVRTLPCWVGSRFPAVVTQSAMAVARDDIKEGHGAFVLKLQKVAFGEPLDPEFHARGQNGAFSPAIGLSVHRCRTDGSPLYGPLPKHDIGVKWQTQYCFDMPSAFAAKDELLITGDLVHRRWFGEVREAIPPFTMCPIGMTLSKDETGDRCLPS